jgi:hypothetical protein
MEGHVGRYERIIIRKVLIDEPIGKCSKERPRQRWKDKVNVDIKMVDVIANIETAIARDKWRGLIEAVKDFNGP